MQPEVSFVMIGCSVLARCSRQQETGELPAAFVSMKGMRVVHFVSLPEL
jgi:hypothetical protein